jgi:hypothetical protein
LDNTASSHPTAETWLSHLLKITFGHFAKSCQTTKKPSLALYFFTLHSSLWNPASTTYTAKKPWCSLSQKITFWPRSFSIQKSPKEQMPGPA